jgi:hypothetical protein
LPVQVHFDIAGASDINPGNIGISKVGWSADSNFKVEFQQAYHSLGPTTGPVSIGAFREHVADTVGGT